MNWTPVYRCCWCGAEFVQQDIDRAMAWVCPTEACRERQLKWKMLDVSGKLFYLPMPKQVLLEEAIESQQYKFICLGGDRAGGKSTTLRIVSYRQLKRFENFEAYFIRREFPQLIKNHLKKAVRESKRLGFGYANKTVTCHETGGTLEFGHCQDPEDYKNYVGAEADLVDFDQLEQFTDTQFTEISAATGRTRRNGWRGLVLAGENPGGPLSAFVDELFISKSRDAVRFPNYDPSLFHFIPIDLDDNPHCDPEYVANLAQIEPIKRAMYRGARRDRFPGQYFQEFSKDLHVLALDVPHDYPRLGAMRWGYVKPGIFLWSIVLPDGRLYVEREWVFSDTVAEDVAIAIRALTAQLGQELIASYGNRDMGDDESSEDIFATLQRNGLNIVAQKHDPIIGWQRLRHWFRPMRPLPQIPIGHTSIREEYPREVPQFVVDGSPAILIHPRCETLIRTLPQLLQGKTDPEDVLKDGPTQGATALRHLVMARPYPLDLQRGKSYPTDSAGALMQQLIRSNTSHVLGRHNVSR